MGACRCCVAYVGDAQLAGFKIGPEKAGDELIETAGGPLAFHLNVGIRGRARSRFRIVEQAEHGKDQLIVEGDPDVAGILLGRQPGVVAQHALGGFALGARRRHRLVAECGNYQERSGETPDDEWSPQVICRDRRHLQDDSADVPPENSDRRRGTADDWRF